MDSILIYIINHPHINRNTTLVNGAGSGRGRSPPPDVVGRDAAVVDHVGPARELADPADTRRRQGDDGTHRRRGHSAAMSVRSASEAPSVSRYQSTNWMTPLSCAAEYGPGR